MKYFFELIQVAVGTRQDLSATLQPEKWQRLYHEARRQALLGVLYEAITRLPKAQMPPKSLLFQWYGVAEKIKEQNRQINAEAVRLGQWLQAQGMDYTVLKGQGIATLYPEPLLRNPGDIDVWVRPPHYEQIPLSERRYQLVEFSKQLGTIDNICYHHLHFPFSETVEVELHFTPTWKDNWLLNKRLQRYFTNLDLKQSQQLVDLPEGAGQIQIPSTDFNAFYVLLHIYHHLFGEGIGLRQLMDYYYVLHRDWDEATKKQIIQLLKEQHMLTFTGATMYVLKVVFGLDEAYFLVPANEKEGRFLLKEILLAGNFGQYDSRIKHSQQQNDLAKFLRSLQRLVKFAWTYPWEVLSNPFFRIYHYFYRKRRGWR